MRTQAVLALLQNLGHWRQGVLGHHAAIGSAKVGCQDNRLGALVQDLQQLARLMLLPRSVRCLLDGRQSTVNALRVGDLGGVSLVLPASTGFLLTISPPRSWGTLKSTRMKMRLPFTSTSCFLKLKQHLPSDSSKPWASSMVSLGMAFEQVASHHQASSKCKRQAELSTGRKKCYWRQF